MALLNVISGTGINDNKLKHCLMYILTAARLLWAQKWKTEEVPVTYSTDVTCLSWVWRESSILWGVEGGTSGGGAVLYIYVERVWRSLEAGGKAERRSLSGSLCVRQGTTVCQSVPT